MSFVHHCPKLTPPFVGPSQVRPEAPCPQSRITPQLGAKTCNVPGSSLQPQLEAWPDDPIQQCGCVPHPTRTGLAYSPLQWRGLAQISRSPAAAHSSSKTSPVELVLGPNRTRLLAACTPTGSRCRLHMHECGGGPQAQARSKQDAVVRVVGRRQHVVGW